MYGKSLFRFLHILEIIGKFTQGLVVYAVMHPKSLFVSIHQTAAAQQFHMIAQSRLAAFEMFENFVRAHFLAFEHLENAHSVAVAQSFANVDIISFVHINNSRHLI